MYKSVINKDIVNKNIMNQNIINVRIYSDKKILNPVLSADKKAVLKVEAELEDGSLAAAADLKVEFLCRTKHSSGKAEVLKVDAAGIVTPLNGGTASIEARVTYGGKTYLSDELMFVVRPFYREYHQTLTMKMFMGMEGWIENSKDLTVVQTFQSALDTIKKIDCLTRGIPKIIYLVGWQEGGHDHMYPSWFEVNHLLRREEDETALQSLKWLINEAEKYNTSVSLHINMNDAYEDSPYFQTYLDNDLLARNKDGSLLTFDFWKDRPMYCVSPTLEWEKGFAKKRIDQFCDMFPELLKSHTIHIDNWVVKSHHDGGPLSPYHNVTIEQDEEVQRKLFHYWRSKGFDVTSEGADHGRTDPKIGLQPMTWWGLKFDPMEIPASLYCGGRVDRHDGDPRFGDSMHGEDIFLRNFGKPDILEGFTDEFCSNTLMWYYLNRLERLRLENDVVYYSEGVVAGCKDGRVLIKKGDMVLRNGDILFVPVLWKEQREIMAYSRRTVHITNALPEEWSDVESVDVFGITQTGVEPLTKGIRVKDGRVELPLQAGRAVVIIPVQ